MNITLKIASFIKPAFLHPAKIVAIPAGRRTGKTYNAAVWLIAELLAQPNRSGLWVDSRQINLEKYVDRYFRRILGEAWTMFRWNPQKKVLYFPNKSYIDFGSAERPENLEGFDYDRAILNEAGIIFRKANLWDNTLAPMFKNKDTKVRLVGTPKGRNKFRDIYSMGVAQQQDYASFRFSVYDSPFYTESEIAQLKASIPELAWKQEALAEFLEGAGSVFRNIQACIEGLLLDEPVAGHQYFMSFDLAKHQDFTWILVGDQSKRVVYSDRFNHIDWTLQKQRILNVYKNFQPVITIMDSTGVGDAIYDDLRSQGMNVHPFKFTSITKSEIVRNLSVALENRSITFPNIPELIDELEMFEYEMRPSGTVGYSAPDGFHDDGVMALAMLNELYEGGGHYGDPRFVSTGGDYEAVYDSKSRLRNRGDLDSIYSGDF